MYSHLRYRGRMSLQSFYWALDGALWVIMSIFLTKRGAYVVGRGCSRRRRLPTSIRTEKDLAKFELTYELEIHASMLLLGASHGTER